VSDPLDMDLRARLAAFGIGWGSAATVALDHLLAKHAAEPQHRRALALRFTAMHLRAAMLFAKRDHFFTDSEMLPTEAAICAMSEELGDNADSAEFDVFSEPDCSFVRVKPRNEGTPGVPERFATPPVHADVAIAWRDAARFALSARSLA